MSSDAAKTRSYSVLRLDGLDVGLKSTFLIITLLPGNKSSSSLPESDTWACTFSPCKSTIARKRFGLEMRWPSTRCPKGIEMTFSRSGHSEFWL